MEQPDGKANQHARNGPIETAHQLWCWLRGHAPQDFKQAVCASHQQDQANERRAVDVPAPQRGRSAALADQRPIARGDAPVTDPDDQADEQERHKMHIGIDLPSAPRAPNHSRDNVVQSCVAIACHQPHGARQHRVQVQTPKGARSLGFI